MRETTTAPAAAKTAHAIAARRIVLADRETAGTVHIEGGMIVGLEEHVFAPHATDFGTDTLIPGLIELHTDHLETHLEPRPNVGWEPVSAVFAYDSQIAAAGITTVFDCLRAGSDIDRPGNKLMSYAQAIETAKATGLLRAEHHTHLRCEICSDDVLDEVVAFLARFDVRLMSLMDHTPGARQFRDEAKLREYYRGKSHRNDEQLDAMFARRRTQFMLNHDRHRRDLVAIARDRGIALASHDDTTVAHVEESVADKVSLAEFPTTFEAAEACRAHGIKVMMGAPNMVRGGSHSGNVSAAELAHAGLLDVLSSDYVPASLLMAPFQWAAKSGAAKSGTALPAAIALVTKGPADAMGLHDRGEIAVGKRADLVRVAMAGDLPVVRELWRQGIRIS